MAVPGRPQSGDGEAAVSGHLRQRSHGSTRSPVALFDVNDGPTAGRHMRHGTVRARDTDCSGTVRQAVSANSLRALLLADAYAARGMRDTSGRCPSSLPPSRHDAGQPGVETSPAGEQDAQRLAPHASCPGLDTVAEGKISQKDVAAVSRPHEQTAQWDSVPIEECRRPGSDEESRPARHFMAACSAPVPQQFSSPPLRLPLPVPLTALSSRESWRSITQSPATSQHSIRSSIGFPSQNQPPVLSSDPTSPLSFLRPLPGQAQLDPPDILAALEDGQRPSLAGPTAGDLDQAERGDPQHVHYIKHRSLSPAEFTEAAIALPFDFQTTQAISMTLPTRLQRVTNALRWLLLLAAVISPPTIHFACQASYLNRHLSPVTVYAPIYLLLCSWSSYLRAFCSGPEYVPLGLHPDPDAFLTPRDRDAREQFALESDPAIAALQGDSPKRRQALLQLRLQLTQAIGSFDQSDEGPEYATSAEEPVHALHSQQSSFAIVESRLPSKSSRATLRPPTTLNHDIVLSSQAQPSHCRPSNASRICAIPSVRYGQALLVVCSGAIGDKDQGRRADDWHVPPVLHGDRGGSLASRSIHLLGHDVHIRWCPTCRSYPPPLAAHSVWSGRCVRAYEEHTSWLGTRDLGASNLLPFVTFLGFSSLASAYFAATSAWVLSDLAHRHGAGGQALTGVCLSSPACASLRCALRANPLAGVVFALSIVLLTTTLLPRLLRHIACAWSAETTVLCRSAKIMRKVWGAPWPLNPYRQTVSMHNATTMKKKKVSGWRSLCHFLLCTPPPSSGHAEPHT